MCQSGRLGSWSGTAFKMSTSAITHQSQNYADRRCVQKAITDKLVAYGERDQVLHFMGLSTCSLQISQQPTNQSTNQPTNQPANQPTN